jgi:hypothetical protein
VLGYYSWRGGLLVAASLLLLPVFAGPPSSEDRSWKNYYNPQGRYCIDYPSRWTSGGALEGAGFFVKPKSNQYSKPLAEIDVAVLPNRVAETTLTEEAQLRMAALRNFERAEGLQLIDQHDTQVSGSPALFSRDTYYDPESRIPMVDEVIFANHGGMLYRLELTSRADELGRFEPVFQHQVSSFRFDCPPHRIPRNFGSVDSKKDRAAAITQPVLIHPHAAAN